MHVGVPRARRSDKTQLDTLLAAGWTLDEDVSWPAQAASAYPVYQLFNPYETHNTHIWTTDANEYDELQTAG